MLLASILPPETLASLSERELQVLTSVALAEVVSSEPVRQVLAKRVQSAASSILKGRVAEPTLAAAEPKAGEPKAKR